MYSWDVLFLSAFPHPSGKDDWKPNLQIFVGALRKMKFRFTSFSGHRPAQREWAQTGLKGPMQGAILTQSHNPLRLATSPGSTTPTLFEQ